MHGEVFDYFWGAWVEGLITDEEYNAVNKILRRLEYGDEE